jgi:hypothetical protein
MPNKRRGGLSLPIHSHMLRHSTGHEPPNDVRDVERSSTLRDPINGLDNALHGADAGPIL